MKELDALERSMCIDMKMSIKETIWYTKLATNHFQIEIKSGIDKKTNKNTLPHHHLEHNKTIKYFISTYYQGKLESNLNLNNSLKKSFLTVFIQPK